MTLARAISYVCLCASFTVGSIDWAESSERSRLHAAAGLNVLENNPPELCVGHGDLDSISLTDWEAGLEGWTVNTHDIANPPTFNTPDWAVVESLPDGRPGMAAFVANLETGACGEDDESGALTLDSPSILIPAGTVVPRISVDHWVATEFGYDGGNIKISVNGSGFNLIPKSAIDFNPYNSTLIAAIDSNTNPLAGEDAFTGANNGQQTGSWGQSHINLFGIAEAEDTIQLRFDFGVDDCHGLIGWYVDDVEVYSCSAELPPSDCGNGVLDTGEQCDDGNTFIDDGCSNTCQIDDGWQCTDPAPAGNVLDGSFEAGTPSPFWTESSTNFGTPICDEVELECGTGAGTGPADGIFWAWFGGIEEYEESSLSQVVVIPSTSNELRFELEVSTCDSASDYLEVLVDSIPEFLIDGSSLICGGLGYTTQSVDISAYADDASHDIEFHSESFANNLDLSNFFVDAVSIPGGVSLCTRSSLSLTLIKEVINDSGGTATASDWTLNASGPTSFSGTGPRVTSGTDFMAGRYDLSESGGPAGYTASAWVCVGGTQNDADTVTLTADDVVTCTISNDDDVAPATHLTLLKEVINDNGGNAQASAWTLSANGPTPFSGAGPIVSSAEGFEAGRYDLSESGGPAGYTASDWFCDGGTQNDADSITLGEGESATCTITNDDVNPDFQINAGHSGAWFNPVTSGQGLLLDVEPAEQYMFVAWFTYTDAASDSPFEQRWLTAQGNYIGNTAVLELYETLGGKFDDPQAVTTTKIGEITVSFSDCGHGQATYSFDEEGLQGEFPLERAIPGSENTCDELDGSSTQAVDINAGMDGAWFDPATSGQGYLVDSYPNPDGSNFIFVAWFTFGEDTASGQRWFTAQGGFAGSLAELDVYESSGGSFDDPQAPDTVKVGTMSIDFTDCSNALLTYALPDDSAEGDVAIQRAVPGAEALCEELAGGSQ